jgi:hypothetical protein
MRKRVGSPRSARSAPICEQFHPSAIAQAVGVTQYILPDSVLSDGSRMTADKDKKTSRVKDSRQDRLKDKLRENLKRRKSQERERGKMTEAPSHDEKASPHGEVGKPRA